MNVRIWGTWLLSAFFSSVVLSQSADQYLNRPLPDSWQEDSTFQQTLPINDAWWKAFGDSVLDSLIQVAVKQNYSVRMAVDRIAMAKAQLRIQRGNYFPTLTLGGGWNKQQNSGNTSQLPQSTNEYTDASLGMSWEADVFGSIRNRVRAQKESFAATKEEYNAAMVSLCAQVASAYINLRELQQEMEVTLRNSNSQEEVLHITEVRFETGLASALDVAQAKSVYYNTKASLPMLEAEIIQYSNSLAILLGLYPEGIRQALAAPRPLPHYVELVSVGIPANLLRRRPDVRGAERLIAAQAASVGASRSDWWPKFYLKGSVGYASHDFNKLTNKNSMTYEIAPSMTWTLFQGTQLINATRLAKAQLDETINQFNQTVLTAVQEVDNAQSAYRNSVKQTVVMQEVVYQGKKTLELSLDLYKKGLSPFQNVLDAQRSLLSYENTLVQTKGNSLLLLIQLYQALGGGWNNQDVQ